MKQCSKCWEWKDKTKFTKDKQTKDGLFRWCKECHKYYNKKYNKNNKDRIKENKKEYYKNNKDKTKEHDKIYYESNKDKIRKNKKEYNKNNKDKIIKKNWKKKEKIIIIRQYRSVLIQNLRKK